MKNKILLFLLLMSWPMYAVTPKETFEVGKRTFLLNGNPFVVKAAELHYARIPEPYWEHRILMCKALGMNTICLYMFWNYHEQQEGKFDFSGEKNVAKLCISSCVLVRMCVRNGRWADCLGGCSKRKI